MEHKDAAEWVEKLISTMKEETSGKYPDPKYKDEVYEALNEAIKILKQTERIPVKMYQIVGRYTDYDPMDTAYFVVDTEEEAKEAVEYARLYHYREEEDDIEEWYYTEITHGDALKEIQKECRTAERLKKLIEEYKENIDYYKRWNEARHVEVCEHHLALLQAELAELESEVK